MAEQDIDYSVLTDDELKDLYDVMVQQGHIDPRMTFERGVRRFQRQLPTAARSTIELLFTKHPNPFLVSHLLPIPAARAVELLAMAVNATDGAARSIRGFLEDLTAGGRILMDQALKKAAKYAGADRREDVTFQVLLRRAEQLEEQGVPRDEWPDLLGKSYEQLAAGVQIEWMTGMTPDDWTRWIQAVEIAQEELEESSGELWLPVDLQLQLGMLTTGPMAGLITPGQVIADYYRGLPPPPPKPKATLDEIKALAKRYYEEARAQGAFPLQLKQLRENPFSDIRRNDLVTLPNGKKVWGNGDDVVWVDEEIMEMVVDRVETFTRLVKVPAVEREARAAARIYLREQGIKPTEQALRQRVVDMEESDPELKARMYVEREESRTHMKRVGTGKFRKVPKHADTLDGIIRRRKPLDQMELERLTRQLRGGMP